jgi:hypothetical protein
VNGNAEPDGALNQPALELPFPTKLPIVKLNDVAVGFGKKFCAVTPAAGTSIESVCAAPTIVPPASTPSSTVAAS